MQTEKTRPRIAGRRRSSLTLLQRWGGLGETEKNQWAISIQADLGRMGSGHGVWMMRPEMDDLGSGERQKLFALTDGGVGRSMVRWMLREREMLENRWSGAAWRRTMAIWAVQLESSEAAKLALAYDDLMDVPEWAAVCDRYRLREAVAIPGVNSRGRPL